MRQDSLETGVVTDCVRCFMGVDIQSACFGERWRGLEMNEGRHSPCSNETNDESTR